MGEQGRTKWVNPNPPKEEKEEEEEEDDSKEEAVEPEVGPPLLHPLQNDDRKCMPSLRAIKDHRLMRIMMLASTRLMPRVQR